MPTEKQLYDALATVMDPEIHKPITELDMVKTITIDGPNVIVEVLLTVAGCPMKDRLTKDVTAAVSQVEGVGCVEVVLGVLTEEKSISMYAKLRSVQPYGQDQRVAF